jgi:hypothetical protein
MLFESRADEELDRWFSDPVLLATTSENNVETVVRFWKQILKGGSYQCLPQVARIIYALPASSAQIERDFGVSGMMVTSQRASLSPHDIDMCAFLNRNRAIIDVTQCPIISASQAKGATPSNVTLDLDPINPMAMFESEWEIELQSAFSMSTEL